MLGSKNTSATELKAIIRILDDDITELIKTSKETNRLLTELVTANKNFVGVIENFFALRKKIDIEEARRREKRELDLHATEADNRY